MKPTRITVGWSELDEYLDRYKRDGYELTNLNANGTGFDLVFKLKEEEI